MSAPTQEVTPNPFLDPNQQGLDMVRHEARWEMEADPQHALPETAPGSLGKIAMSDIRLEAFDTVNGYDTEHSTRQKETMLGLVRQQLSQVTKGEQKRIGKRLLGSNPPEWLVESIGGKDVEPAEFTKLLTSQDEDGKFVVENNKLANLLEWYQKTEADRSQAFNKEVIAPMRGRFVERMQKAIDAGWVPADALSEERLEIINNTPVFIDDDTTGDALFDGWMGGAAAYATAQGQDQKIVYRNSQAQKRQKNVEHTFTHEMVHMITGHTPEPSDNYSFLGQEARPVTETYGMGRLFKKAEIFSENEGSDMNEAVTEHFAQALLGGDIEKITPRDFNSYGFQRYVLKELCTRGKAPVSPQLFVRAMLADKPHDQSRRRSIEDAEPQAITELREALSRAYPDRDPAELYNAAINRPKATGKVALMPRREASKEFSA